MCADALVGGGQEGQDAFQKQDPGIHQWNAVECRQHDSPVRILEGLGHPRGTQAGRHARQLGPIATFGGFAQVGHGHFVKPCSSVDRSALDRAGVARGHQQCHASKSPSTNCWFHHAARPS
jgi:hypothetical protein